MMKESVMTQSLFKSLIDDVRMKGNYGNIGYPIRFSNEEFRKAFDLVRLEKDDILYDLGSGWGQSLIIALTEYDVKKAVGIESNRKRCAYSLSRLKSRTLEDRGTTIFGSFQHLYSDRLKGANPAEPTVIFYGIESDRPLIRAISKKAQKGCRLIYYFNGLFPEIKPIDWDYPFYVSVQPFEKPVSEYDWLISIIHKKRPRFLG